MGLFDKIKNVLFEEEEVEIPVITKVEEKPKVQQKVVEPQFDDSMFEDNFEEVKEITPKETTPKEKISDFRNVKREFDFDFDEKIEEDNNEFIEDLEEIKEEKVEEKSPFLTFDEDEFDRYNSRIKPIIEETPKRTYEEPKRFVSKKVEPKVEIKAKEPVSTFRLSPIISPVYGILDKNYKKEDIVEKTTMPFDEEIENIIDIDSVRRKAFGTLEEEIANQMPVKNNEIKDEPLDDSAVDDLIMDSIDDEIESSIVEDHPEIISDSDIMEEEKEEVPNKEYDEILNNDDDDYLDDDLDDEEEVKETPNEILEKTSTLEILDEIEKELDDVSTNKKKLENDTLETDLFNLIDSMYTEDDE